MLTEQLNKAWRAQRRSSGSDLVMRFTREGLILGAGTVLAKSRGDARRISIDPAEPRLRGLLVVAHLGSPTDRSLSHLRKAAERWSEGQDAMAAMHLALSGLERLERPEADAHRLFLADELLKAGFEPEAIIDAIEVGDAALSRFRKYDPDQARVPAGSGRTSGQWTSGDGGASSDENPEGASRPEVNPDTVTPIADQEYATPIACEVAHAHCYDAAHEAAPSEAANDTGPRNLDYKSCNEALIACKIMSVEVQLQPFLPIGGGVIFPHRGIVRIDKGLMDRYIPPRFGFHGKQWPDLRRSEISRMKDEQAESYSAPPCEPAPDETAPSSPAGFSGCNQLIEAFASRIGGKITDRTSTLSKNWGKIVRAKVQFKYDSSYGTALLTCWSRSQPSVRFNMTFDCCGDCAKQ